jgi:ribonuclease G
LDTFDLEPIIPKDGQIDNVLEKGDILIFQISKEAISTKGPRLTCELIYRRTLFGASTIH